MGQILLPNAKAILLQNATKVYYKMRQFYYNMRQLLQNASKLLKNVTFITNCVGIATSKTVIDMYSSCPRSETKSTLIDD